MHMKKSVIIAGLGTAAVLVVGFGIWLLRPPAATGPVQETEQKGVATTVEKSEGLANEDVLLIEGGTATSENFMMVTNPPKK
jgi:hypothetical protein